jgi:nicotinamidase-related amidase
MSSAVQVLDSDYVIATGQQLHELCRERGILHLVYVGFATNWCVLGRDYGVRAMAGRGYNVILLREATTGVEFPDTVATLFVTEIAIREVEQQHGFSASNGDFIAACRAAAG